jgi:hypothetical protein
MRREQKSAEGAVEVFEPTRAMGKFGEPAYHRLYRASSARGEDPQIMPFTTNWSGSNTARCLLLPRAPDPLPTYNL